MIGILSKTVGACLGEIHSPETLQNPETTSVDIHYPQLVLPQYLKKGIRYVYLLNLTDTHQCILSHWGETMDRLFCEGIVPNQEIPTLQKWLVGKYRPLSDITGFEYVPKNMYSKIISITDRNIIIVKPK